MKLTATLSKPVIAIALIAIWLTALAYAAQEKRESLRQAKPKIIDLRRAMKRMKLKEGSNVVHSRRGVKLIAEVKYGKVVEWRATSSNGTAIPVQVQPTSAKEKRPCVVCPITDTTGPLDDVCYKIDCDKLPKPGVVKP